MEGMLETSTPLGEQLKNGRVLVETASDDSSASRSGPGEEAASVMTRSSVAVRMTSVIRLEAGRARAEGEEGEEGEWGDSEGKLDWAERISWWLVSSRRSNIFW